MKALIGETVKVNGKTVENVLVHSGDSQAVGTASDAGNYVGPIAQYTLYFPETYTDEIAGATVEVRGHSCKVIGYPDHERPRQVFGHWTGLWDMVVRVGKTEADVDELVRIYATEVQRNVLGDRYVATIDLFNGSAQVRQIKEDEANKTPGTIATKKISIVTDWFDAFNEYQPQSLFVEYLGKTFNVYSVENINEDGETACLEAVWNG